MKKSKILMPILGVAASAAMITPLVCLTSCSMKTDMEFLGDETVGGNYQSSSGFVGFSASKKYVANITIVNDLVLQAFHIDEAVSNGNVIEANLINVVIKKDNKKVSESNYTIETGKGTILFKSPDVFKGKGSKITIEFKIEGGYSTTNECRFIVPATTPGE